MHYPILVEMGNGCFDAPLPEEVASRLLADWEEQMQQYEEQMRLYNEALPDYQQQMQVYRELRAGYERDLLLYEYNARQQFRTYLESIECKGQDKVVLEYLQKDVLSHKQLNQVEKAIKRHKQAFQPQGKKPKQPQKPQEPKMPFAPSEPSLKTSIPIEQYQPGLVPEVDAAIAWVREALNRPDLQPSGIDDDFVCCDLDYYLGNHLLEQLRKLALEIFQQVIDGSLSDPQVIYEELTNLELDYSEALGMESHHDSRNYTTTHRDYSKWHEINFSSTGYWLIEFESLEVPEITLHVPYERRDQLGLGIDWRSLPVKETEQGTFGRAISPLEQRAYPLPGLLELLGASVDDFPYGLEQYRREHPMRYYDWYDEDDDEFDFEF